MHQNKENNKSAYIELDLNTIRCFIIGIIIFIGIAIIILTLYYLQILRFAPFPTAIHKFKMKQIYPTRQDGREWFINLDNPTSDGIFDHQSIITRQPDG